MKRILLLLVLCLGTLTLQGQGFQWLQNGGGTVSISGSNYYRQEQVIDIATDSQRNVYVVSVVSMLNAQLGTVPVTTFEQDPNDTDFVIASYSCDGTYRWHKVFGSGGDDFPAGIEVDSQDNVYVVGYLKECRAANQPYYAIPQIGDNSGIDYTSTNSPTACQRAFMAKFNSNGVFQWIHYTHAPLASVDPSLHPFMVRNFYMVNDVIHWILWIPPGTYENGAFSNTNTNLPFLFYVLQYDTSGNFISATPFDLQLSNYTSCEMRWYRNPYNGYYYAIHANNNNSITMTANNGSTSMTPGPSKIICFNALGQYQWHTESTGVVLELSDVDFDVNNNVYLSGRTNNFAPGSFLGWDISNLPFGAVGFVMKCNPTVTSYDWVSHYDPPGGQLLYSSMKYTPTAIYFAGQMVSSPFVWGNQSITGPGTNNGFDPLLARLDPATGACTSLHRIVGNNGSNDTFTAMEFDNAGDLILGGRMGYALTDSNNVTHYAVGGNTDFFVTKFASQACQSLGTTLFEDTQIRLYPNPSKGMVTLDYQLETAAQLQIIDVSGCVVLERELAAAETSLQIDTKVMASGVYAVQVLGSDGGVWRSKLIVE